MSDPGGKFPASVRRASGVGPQTPMQLPVHPELVEKYLENAQVRGDFDAHRAGGFVCRLQDVAAETRASAVAECHGLDKAPEWPRGGPLHVLRFYAHNPELFNTPFGARTTEGAARFESAAVYPEPFLGTGYTPSTAHVVPEYFLPLTELPAGTEMWRIEESGESRRVGVYEHRRIGWIRTGPEPRAAKPAPLRLSVRRGLFARYQGQWFEADYGYAPGNLVLHPMPDGPVPEDFEDRSGIRIRKVVDAQLDEIVYYRQRCTWRGGAFEILDADEENATLNFLGENHEQAATLGLTEVSYRIWHAVVPRRELTDVHEERALFPAQGQFGGTR